MAKNSFTQYFAKRSDERLQKFLKLHEPETLEKISDPKPAVSTKMVDRRTEHGYNPGEDEKAYDSQESKNEEVEINELSKKTLGSYIKKAGDEMVSASKYQTHFERDGDHDKAKTELRHRFKRKAGVNKAIGKLTKEEVEISEGKKLQKIEVVNKTTGKKTYHEVHASKAFAALNHHRKSPYTKSARIVAEGEEINELSKETLKSYGKKALKSMIKHYDKGNAEEDKAMSTDGHKYPEKQARHQKLAAFHQRKEYNREKGTTLVTKKLTGLAKRNV